MASVGTLSQPTSTGSQAITGVGFAPKLVIPFASVVAAPGGVVDALLGIGAMTASSQGSISMSSRNLRNPTAVNSRHGDNAISQIVETSVSFSASRTSLDADGFTLNWDTVNASSFLFNHLSLGGSAFEASVTHHQLNATNAAQAFAHGLSGAPTAIILINSGITAAPPVTQANINNSVGLWAGASQIAAGWRSLNNVTPTNTARTMRNDASLVYITPTLVRSMAIGSVDATNVNCTYPVTTSADQLRFMMIAMRGAGCKVGTFDCNGSLDPLTITCPGITPRLVFFVLMPTGSDSINTVTTPLVGTFAASDGTKTVSSGVTDQHAVATSNTRRVHSSTEIHEIQQGNGTDGSRSGVSFSGESIIVDPTVNFSTSWAQGAYLIIGE